MPESLLPTSDSLYGELATSKNKQLKLHIEQNKKKTDKIHTNKK